MKRLGILILVIISLCVSCKKEKKTYFPENVPAIKVQIDRFDNALLQMDTTNWDASIDKLYEDYPVFMPIFVDELLAVEKEDLPELLGGFLADSIFQKINAREQSIMRDINYVQRELNTAFSRLHYLYPKLEIPTITFFISGFNAKILYLPNGIGVDADYYLGSDYEYYNGVVHNYQKTTLRKECIPADVVAAYLYNKIPFASSQSRLIDQMIHQGKIYFLMSQLLPNESKYEIMGYTKEQWQWCEKYEKQIWQHVMDQQVLYTHDRMVLTSYLNDGPFTAEVSQDAPGRLGIWLGWRIVESYMNNNEKVSLTELMAEKDAQAILRDSHYGN